MQNIAIHNTAIGANTNFFTPIGPTNLPFSTFTIQATITGAGILSVQKTNTSGSGGTVVINLNGGAATTANVPVTFSLFMNSGDTMTLQTTIAGTILDLTVREHPAVI